MNPFYPDKRPVNIDPHELVDTNGAAEMLGVTQRRVEYILKTNRIPYCMTTGRAGRRSKAIMQRSAVKMFKLAQYIRFDEGV